MYMVGRTIPSGVYREQIAAVAALPRDDASCGSGPPEADKSRRRRTSLRAATPLVILGDRIEGLQPRICVL